MNPESNRFQRLGDETSVAKMIERYYSDRDEPDIPIFNLGERIEIKGYIFEVIQISANRLAFAPIEKAPRKKDVEGIERLKQEFVEAQKEAQKRVEQENERNKWRKL